MKIWTKLSPSTPLSDRTLPVERGADGKLALAGFRALEHQPRGPLARLRRLFTRAPFTWLVLLPTLVVAVYMFAIAAPQYVSESRFTVKSRQQPAGGLLAEAMQSAGMRTASEEALAVRDHILSLDALAALRPRMDLVEIWRRPEADFWARHWFAEPPAERLLDYYRDMVHAVLDASTGITTLTVRSFRPADSLEINRALLEVGETLVNRLNQRILDTTVGTARLEVARAGARPLAHRHHRRREHRPARCGPGAGAHRAAEPAGLRAPQQPAGAGPAEPHPGARIADRRGTPAHGRHRRGRPDRAGCCL
jgi:capsular polysaccharide transport system permease protein